MTSRQLMLKVVTVTTFDGIEWHIVNLFLDVSHLLEVNSKVKSYYELFLLGWIWIYPSLNEVIKVSASVFVLHFMACFVSLNLCLLTASGHKNIKLIFPKSKQEVYIFKDRSMEEKFLYTGYNKSLYFVGKVIPVLVQKGKKKRSFIKTITWAAGSSAEHYFLATTVCWLLYTFGKKSYLSTQDLL